MSVFNRGGRFVSADVMDGLGAGSHPRISIKGSRFTLVDAGGTRYPWPALVLPVVIIGANPKASKIFYASAYDPDAGEPPTCFSDNGVAPSVNAGEPQARTCAECQWFGWGSATSQMTGKKTKACSDKKKLAVVVPGDTTHLAYELQVPPASLKSLNAYAGMVGSMTIPDGSRRADLSDVVTLVSFVVDGGAVGLLEFQNWGWIDSVGPDHQLTYDQQGRPLASPDGGETFGAFIDDLWGGTTVDTLVNLNDKPWHGAGQVGAAPAPAQVTHNPSPAQHIPPPAANRPPLVAAPPFAPPAGAQPQQPVQAVPATQRGGARTAAPRKPKLAAAPAASVAPPGAPPFVPPMAAAVPPAERVDDGLAIPAFLQRNATPAGPGNGGAPLQDAAAPPANIQTAINQAFNLRT